MASRAAEPPEPDTATVIVDGAPTAARSSGWRLPWRRRTGTVTAVAAEEASTAEEPATDTIAAGEPTTDTITADATPPDGATPPLTPLLTGDAAIWGDPRMANSDVVPAAAPLAAGASQPGSPAGPAGARQTDESAIWGGPAITGGRPSADGEPAWGGPTGETAPIVATTGPAQSTAWAPVGMGIPSLSRPSTVPGEPIVELELVSRIYQLGHVEVPALVNANLVVGRGEFVAIVGPSGSGKSTLMNLIGCLDRPSSGVYRLAGTPVSSLGDDDLAHVRSRLIGFVFQSYNLLPRTTAIENVATPLMYQGVSRRERYAKAAAALERLGLADRLNHVPTELSGGQQQRVAIARALVTDPALILADEPTGNLDSHSGAEVMGILHELHASGRTIVLITHDSNVAAAASRRVLIADGQLSIPIEARAA